MVSFKKIYDALVAGIDVFQFVKVEDIDVFPTITGLAVKEFDIQLKAGKAWQLGYALDDTLKYSEPTLSSANGFLFNKSLPGLLPNDHLDVAENFFYNHYGQFIVKYIDRNGVRRLLGTPDEPMLISYSYKQEANHAGEKGWAFSFYGKHTLPSLYLELPPLPQLYVENGYLMYKEGLAEEFALLDGNLVVTGDKEAQYYISQGNLNFDTNP